MVEDVLSDDSPASDMVPKAKVEELIKKAKLSAADKARLEMQALHAEELEQMKAQQPQQSVGMGGQAPVDMNAIQAEIANKVREELIAEARTEHEKMLKEQSEAQAQQVAKTFYDRIGAADREAYKDFDEVTGEMDIRKFPNLVGMLTEFDNTADMLYDIASNSGKLANLAVLSKEDPKYAYAQLKKLSESIKSNKQIKEAHPTTNAPLSHVRPSASAGTDGGNMSVSDLRKMKNLRG